MHNSALAASLKSKNTRFQSTINTETSLNKDFLLKFTEPKAYPVSEHLEKLATSKPEYHSRDFFLNKDFRGLFLADHQEAIGDRAFQCVDELNRTVLTQFKTLTGFNEALSKRKEIAKFYKEEVIPQIKMEKRLMM